jgi:hypothetical protein
LHPINELVEMDPESEEYLSLRVELVRARNQVSDALKEAIELVGMAISSLSR